jgi:site-specific DNA recombinase
MLRCAIYARLSRDDAGEAENVEIQKAECVDYAERQGWTVAEIFEDNDISAYSGAFRPRYQALLDFIQEGNAEVVLVTETTRLNRKLWESIGLFRLAESTPLCQIATTDGGGYELSTPQGIHNAIAAAIDAEKESLRLSERQRRKKRVQAKNGQYAGGPRPYGYEKDGTTVREAEAAIIRECAARLIGGYSLRSLAADLNLRGVLNSTGKSWHSLTLKRVLMSKRIIGIRVHQTTTVVNGQRIEEVNEYPAQWPAILDPVTWEHVQLILRAERRRHGGQPGQHYLLTGLVVCGRCGAYLKGGRKPDKAGDKRRRRYQCRHFDGNTGLKTGCGRISRLAEPVEQLVTEAVLYRYDSEGMAQAYEQLGRPQVRDLLDQYNAQKLKLDDLIADYATGLLNREQLAQAKTIVERALDETRAKLDHTQHGRTLAALPIGQTVKEAWEQNTNLDWRRSLIALIVEKVIIRPGYSRKHRWRQWVFDPSSIEIVWRV